MGRNNPAHISVLNFRGLFRFGEAIPAIYRFVATRLKGYLCRLAASSASYGIHLARSPIAVAAAIIAEALGSSGRTASRTTPGLIGKAFGGEELLLFYREGEGFAAIGTLKGFLCVSH